VSVVTQDPIPQETRLLLIECRNELYRWAQLGTGHVLVSSEDASTARELTRKIETYLNLPRVVRKVAQ